MRGRCAPDRSGSISEARASPSDVTEVEGTTCGGEEIVSGPRYLDEPPRGTSPESEPVRPDGDFFTRGLRLTQAASTTRTRGAGRPTILQYSGARVSTAHERARWKSRVRDLA